MLYKIQQQLLVFAIGLIQQGKRSIAFAQCRVEAGACGRPELVLFFFCDP